MITFVNAGAEAAANGGNITLNAPASPLDGDIWIANIGGNDTVVPTMVSDWTPIEAQQGHCVWWFRYSGSNPSSFVVTHPGGNAIIGGIAAFRGCVPSGNPIDTVGSYNTSNGTTATALSITPLASECMLVMPISIAPDNDITVMPAGFAAAYEDTGAGTNNVYSTTLGQDASVGLLYQLHTSGATGNQDATIAAMAGWGTQLIALMPPGGSFPAVSSAFQHLIVR